VKRVRALAAGTVALVASLSLASAGTGGDEPADGLIFDAMSAPSTVSYVGTVEELHIGSERSQASVYRIEHRAPNLTRRTYLSPPNLRGDAMISEGAMTYWVDPHARRIVESDDPAVGDQIAYDDNYLLLRSNYRARTGSSESMDGRPVVDVSLINAHTHATTMLVRIDRRTKLVLDKQQFAADGAMLGETRFESIRYVRTLPASDFALPKRYALHRDPPVGRPSDDLAKLLAHAGFAARTPRALPDGFSPVDGSIGTIGGIRTLHVLYSDGIRTVSLFEHPGRSTLDLSRFHPQSVKIGVRTAQYGSDGSAALLAWTDGRLHYALVGDLRLDELERIAASIDR
jgi:outer membrane lipoprotein-sorting protein